MNRHGFAFDDRYEVSENHLAAARQLSQPDPGSGEMNLPEARRRIALASDYLDELREKLGPVYFRDHYGRWVEDIEARASA